MYRGIYKVLLVNSDPTSYTLHLYTKVLEYGAYIGYLKYVSHFFLKTYNSAFLLGGRSTLSNIPVSFSDFYSAFVAILYSAISSNFSTSINVCRSSSITRSIGISIAASETTPIIVAIKLRPV